MEQIEVLPHPNADSLELARVGDYRAVIPKGQYESGQWCLYIPEQAVLPNDLIGELGLTGKLAGSKKNRVKAIRLRGEISQGIVCRPDVPWINWSNPTDPIKHAGKEDLAERLGIVKWAPPIPAHMAGDVEAAGHLVRWPDIENIKRYPDIFVPGEDVILTEKIHGTCCLITYVKDADTLLVSSKGLGGRNLALKENENNLYWRAVHKYGLRDKLAAMCAALVCEKIAMFGEVYGHGVQDLGYGVIAHADGPGFAGFDLWYRNIHGEEGFVNQRAALALMDSLEIPTVPVVYEGEWDYEFAKKMAEQVEEVSGEGVNIREGLVIRPFEETTSTVTGSRKIGKLISEQYLLRKGDTTEYE